MRLRGALLLVSAAAIATLVISTASAETTETLSSRANAIATSIANDNASAARLATGYLNDRARYAEDEARIAGLAGQIRAVRRQVTKDRAAVTNSAITAYVEAGNGDELDLLISGSANDVASGQTYLGVAEDQLNSELTSLSEAKTRLSIALYATTSAADEAAQAIDNATSSRNAVLAQVADQQRQLGSVKGRLAALVAAETAARERAALQAAEQAAAAQKAAAEAKAGPPATPSAITVSTSSTPTGSPTNSPTGTIPSGSLSDGFAKIRACESGNRYTLNTGNGYYGAYQFSLGTWEGLGYSGLPSEAPASTQDAAAYRLFQRGGWGAWPECAAISGLA